MISKVKQIHSQTNIKRERVLPIAGHVYVRRMQKVSPTDVIVAAPLMPRYMLLDISQGLNVPPTRADELLQRRSGDELSKDDIIAGPVGVLQRVIRAPAAGLVRIAGEGKVLYEIASPYHELQAGLEGTVTNIIPERGAIIETKGALVQGVWGNGKVTFGVIQPVSNDLLQELVPEQLNISFRGAIVTAGFCRRPEVLELAGSIPIKGLVLGSLSSDLVPAASSVSYPILVIDGFGTSPMNSAAEKILTSNKDKNVALNAQKYDPFLGHFPEIIISNSVKSDLNIPVETETLKVGKKVIMVNSPHSPQIGTVDRINYGRHTLPSGIKTSTVDISFGADQKATVPVTNIEIIKV
jgi:hypothetical protein